MSKAYSIPGGYFLDLARVFQYVNEGREIKAMGVVGVQVLRCTGPETCMSAPAGEIANELVLLEYNEESREKGSKGVRS